MHIPVLLNEVIEHLNPKPCGKFIDATIDGGGHALAILERVVPEGKLLGIEWDSRLLGDMSARISKTEFKENIILINESYVNLKQVAEQNNFIGVDGVLFDLGLSSWHLEVAGRGFSFQKDEPLDMRFGINDHGQQPTAEDIISGASYDGLVKILKEYGEERFAKSIAAGIVNTRREKPIRTTLELVEVIKNSVPFWYRRGRLHFATKTFQAIRIAVNSELENVRQGLAQAVEILGAGGRIAVISFHSLEDRIVKNFFREEAQTGNLRIVTKKPVLSKPEEIMENHRARSAKLRVAEKK